MLQPTSLRTGASPAQPAVLLEPAPAPVEALAPDPVAAWGPVQRIFFRLACSYFVLYSLPFPFGTLPYTAYIAQKYQELWNAVVPWMGERVFGLTITVQPNGSGDTTYNYVQVFCFLILALAATVVWTLADQSRRHYSRLHEWLRIYLRFWLAVIMLAYGAMKVIKAQFPGPSLDRLLQPYGDSSPMGILWTLMGLSVGYNLYTGAAEMLGGLLLTTRRTTLLGALVSAAVMSNVAALNA